MVVSESVAVLGAGSWGTALALSARLTGHQTRLWARRNELAREINQGKNQRYLPGVELPRGLRASDSLAECVRGASVLVLAVPSKAVAELCERLEEEELAEESLIVCVAKGLEETTGRRMSEVMRQTLDLSPARQMTLLGPSHAEEVARQLPTAVVLSGGESAHARRVQEALSTAWLRIYTNDDQVGTEYAGALKNILAIAAGMCDGLNLGDNTKGALLTRGLAEIARLGVALGGLAETFYGLSGVGDVITTCLSRHSRNRALGERIARGESLASAMAAIEQTVEGVATVRTAVALADEHEIKMPISRQVLAVLDEGRDPSQALDELMGRALRSEREIASAKRRWQQ